MAENFSEYLCYGILAHSLKSTIQMFSRRLGLWMDEGIQRKAQGHTHKKKLEKSLALIEDVKHLSHDE